MFLLLNRYINISLISLSKLQILVTFNLNKISCFRSLLIFFYFFLYEAAMPVQLLKIIKGKSETPLPSHLQEEDLKDLQEGLDHTNKYVQVTY